MKYFFVLFLLITACATRYPAQQEAVGVNTDLILKDQQVAVEDQERLAKARTQSFRESNLKKGFPITMKIVGEEALRTELDQYYQPLCFARMVEEFLDYLPRTRVINENPKKNITVSDVRGWSDINNYFTYTVTDINNINYTGHIYVTYGVRAGTYYCNAIPHKGMYPSIEMKSPDETIFPVN